MPCAPACKLGTETKIGHVIKALRNRGCPHTHTQRRLLLRGKCGISIRLGFVEVTPAAVPCQMRHVKKLIGLTPAAFPWQAQHFERFVGWGGPLAFQEVIVGPGGAPWLALV